MNPGATWSPQRARRSAEVWTPPKLVAWRTKRHRPRNASAVASSAMRLMSIGQREAHALLAATLARVPAAVDAIEAGLVRGDSLGAFAPAVDLAAMGQQYVRSRLFLS